MRYVCKFIFQHRIQNRIESCAVDTLHRDKFLVAQSGKPKVIPAANLNRSKLIYINNSGNDVLDEFAVLIFSCKIKLDPHLCSPYETLINSIKSGKGIFVVLCTVCVPAC